MLLHHSSSKFCYKLNKFNHYIMRNEKGFYISTQKNPKYFTNFIFTSHNFDYYLITVSSREFVIYKVGEKIEKAIIISNTHLYAKEPLFSDIVLKLKSLNGEDAYIKVTSDLSFITAKPVTDRKIKWRYPSKGSIKLNQCDLTVICNIPILYSLTVNITYPYEGNIPTTFYFNS